VNETLTDLRVGLDAPCAPAPGRFP